MADTEATTNPKMVKLNGRRDPVPLRPPHRAAACPCCPIDRPETKADMIAASRTIQALLITYELDAGHPPANRHCRAGGVASMVARTRTRTRPHRRIPPGRGGGRNRRSPRPGERALKVGLLMLARLDDLRDGDRLTVTEAK